GLDPRLQPEQAPDAVAVAAEDFGLAGQAAGSLRGLLLEDVVAERLPTHELAGARDLEALRRAPVCLHLRHLSSPVAALPAPALSDSAAVSLAAARCRSPWSSGSACRGRGP